MFPVSPGWPTVTSASVALVLHVGAHKTGTSLIQKYFADRARRHRRRPTVGLIARYETNALIGWGRPLLRHPETLRQRIAKEVATGADAVLLSHENSLGRPFDSQGRSLYPRAADLASALSDLCPQDDARLVFYVRPMADFVESYYLQTINEGRSHTFDEWFAGLAEDTLRWRPVVDALDDAFGRPRVAIGDFTELAAGPTEYLRRFMIRSGLPRPARIRYDDIRNPSLSTRGVEIARAINPYLSGAAEQPIVRRFLQQHFSNVTEPRAHPMSEHVRQRLTTATSDEYEAIRRRAGEDLLPSVTADAS